MKKVLNVITYCLSVAGQLSTKLKCKFLVQISTQVDHQKFALGMLNNVPGWKG